ncbi:MAG: UDP-3-O-(3-hydroxymyristoyl)glucosamine N-acyltransferase [Chlamydiales bacterium]|nr:UDP-3-O-(3-hydroxymyristoyl)glucosamine N-acyltransferase [Chlamydiales bacterium]
MERAVKYFRLKELAELAEATLVGDPDHQICGVEALEYATIADASFLANPRYRTAMEASKAGVICIGRETPLTEGRNFLVSDNPSRTFQIIVEKLLLTDSIRSGFTGVHPTAVVHPSVKLGKDVQVGPYAVIDANCTIQERTRIASFVFIGAGSTIGTDCTIHPHVVIREATTIGCRVVLQPGAVIGSCGFGFTTDNKGEHKKLDQLGSVVIEDDVEIGANTTIDRARFKVTKISRGTKIDNLVQIAHNVSIGEHNIIVSQTGIAGSSKTGKHVIIGGQAGIVGHIEIGDHIMIATRGGVSKSISEPGKYSGSPVMSLADHNRQQVHLRKIGEYVKKIEELEERLNALEIEKLEKCIHTSEKLN